jgi:hypothetical protein
MKNDQKSKKRPLRMTSETVRVLGESQLADVVGGAPAASSCNNTCQVCW